MHSIFWAYAVQFILVRASLAAIAGFYYSYKDEPEMSINERKRIFELSDLY